MAYNSTTWSPDTLSKASETSSATLNNATLSGTLTISGATTLNGATQLNSTLSVGVNDTGYDVKFYGATSGRYLLWDESADALKLTDSTSVSFGNDDDLLISHTGSHGYITNLTGGLYIATTTSGVPVSIGHTTSETTVNDNLTVTGDLKLSSNVIKASDGGNTITMDTSDNVTIAGDLTVTGNNISGSGGSVITFNGDDIEFTDNVTLKSDSSRIYFGADSEVNMYHRTDNGLTIEAETGATSTPKYPLSLVHYTSGTPSIGIGTGILFITETAVGSTHTGGNFEAVTTDITDGGEDFDFVWKLMESGNASAERMRLTSAGNLSISGDLTISGGDIDLSGEKSTITLKDNQPDALIIGGADATTTLTVHTSDTVEHVEIITSRSSSAPEFAALDFTSTQIVSGNINDSNSGGISFDPIISGGHTVTRYNYLRFENPSLILSAALTDACVMQFDANAGSHKAVDSGSAHPDIDTTDAWIKININGTIHYIPAYTDKS